MCTNGTYIHSISNINIAYYYEKEVARLIIHGVLHLLGFDHKSNEQHEEMNRIEKKS